MPHINKIAALLSDKNWAVLEAAVPFFAKRSAEERSPHIGTIAALLSGKDRRVQKAAVPFFAECSAEGHSPYIDEIAALFNHEDSDTSSDFLRCGGLQLGW